MGWLRLPLWLSLFLFHQSYGYQAGAPTFACKTMTPGHSVQGQAGPSPYQVQVSAEETDDAGRVRVILQSPPLQFFTGFLIQARSPDSDEALGRFTQVPRNVQLLSCGPTKNNSVTQTSNARKSNVEMEWESPPDYEGPVTFVATMVKDYKTFWIAQESTPVQVLFKRSVDLETASGPGAEGGQVSQAAQGQRNLELNAYKGCGKSKKCLGAPEGCVPGKTCLALVTIAPAGREYQVEMFAKKSKYIAIGFSDDTKMGGDHVVECVNEDLSRGTIVKAYRSFNIPNGKQNRRFDDQEGVELIEGSFYDGDLYCRVHHVAKLQVQDKEYDLNNNEYHLLLAAGSALKPFSVGFHDVAYTSTGDRARVSELKANRATDPFYSDCNQLKSCFGAPEGCIESGSCSAVASVRVEGTRHTFELKAENAAYIALGLSTDNKMGGDSVMECVREDSTGSVKAYNSWNVANDKANKRVGVDGIHLLNSSSVDGSIYCKFTRDPVHRIEGQQFDMTKEQYFLLLAAGSSLKDNSVGFHDQVFTSTAQRRLLADTGAFSTATKLYIRLHGAFMIAAWIGAASIGIVMARYYKQTWIGSSLCTKDIWFAWHRTLMFLTWLLTIAGAILIFYDVGGWVQGPSQTHALVGVVTTVLCFIQPIAAALRPHPGSSKRPLFNWLHWLVGNVAHICAIVTIFLAVQLSKAELPEFVDWILVAFVAFYVAIHLILSLSGCLADSKAEKRINTFPMKDMSPGRGSIHMERKRDHPYAGFRKSTLCLHSLVIVLITVALVLCVVLAPIEKQWGDMKEKFIP